MVLLGAHPQADLELVYRHAPTHLVESRDGLTHETSCEHRLHPAVLAVRVELLGVLNRILQAVPALAVRAFNPKRIQAVHFHHVAHLTAAQVINLVARATDVMRDSRGSQRTTSHGVRTSSVMVATMPLGKVQPTFVTAAEIGSIR